eukprot:365338-Chlamydomonas_euryale.AAC.42
MKIRKHLCVCVQNTAGHTPRPWTWLSITCSRIEGRPLIKHEVVLARMHAGGVPASIRPHPRNT